MKPVQKTKYSETFIDPVGKNRYSALPFNKLNTKVTSNDGNREIPSLSKTENDRNGDRDHEKPLANFLDIYGL
jgi:hypothetical protein